MNYFENERISDIDYVNLCGLYQKSLDKNLELLDYIDDLERACHYFKNVDRRSYQKVGAV